MKKNPDNPCLISASVLAGNYRWTWRFQQNQFLWNANQHECGHRTRVICGYSRSFKLSTKCHLKEEAKLEWPGSRVWTLCQLFL